MERPDDAPERAESGDVTLPARLRQLANWLAAAMFAVGGSFQGFGESAEPGRACEHPIRIRHIMEYLD